MDSLGIQSRPPQLAELEEGQSVTVLVQPKTLGGGAPVAAQYREYKRVGGKLLSCAVKDMSDVDYAEVFPGTVTVTDIPAGAADYDKFLVSDGGMIKYRTAAQMISDLGIATADHTHDVSDMTDVVITGPADLDVLQYDGGSSRWVDRTLAEAGVSAAGHIHDDRYYTETEIDAMPLVEYSGTPTAGHIPYFTAADTIAMDKNRLFWDAANNRLCIGMPTPETAFHIYEDNALADGTVGIRIEQDGEGDSALHFLLTATEQWSIGIDNSDLDKFKICDSGSLGTNTRIAIDSAGYVGFGTTTVPYLVTLKNEGQMGDVSFSSGFGGNDWALTYSGGEAKAEFDHLFVRKSMTVWEFIVNQVYAFAGSETLGPGRGKIASVSGNNWTMEDPMDTGVGASPFTAGDVLLIQVCDLNFNPGSPSYVKYIVRKVSSVSGNVVTVTTATGGPGDTGTPAQGDSVVVIANETDATRRALIYRSVVDSNSPFCSVYTDMQYYADWLDADNIRVHYGNLNGRYGYSSEVYGFAAGNPSGPNVTIDPTNGIRFRATTTVLAQLTGTSFTIKSANTGQRIEIDGVGGTLIFYDTGGEAVKIDDGIWGSVPGVRLIDGVFLIENASLLDSVQLHGINNRGGLTLLDGGVRFFSLNQVAAAGTTEFYVKDLTSDTGTDLVITAANQVVKKSSSRRYKMNIRPLKPDPALLYLTESVSFDWKGSGLPGHYFIAEDMVAIHNDLVHYNNKGLPESVNNEMLMALAVEEIKNHQARLMELEGQVATLRTQLGMA